MSERLPVANWATDFDHLDPRWIEDPFPIWDELRSRCPIAHTERYSGVYLPTRYEDVRAIAYDTTHFSSHKVVVREGGTIGGGSPPITTDPPSIAVQRRCCFRPLHRMRSNVIGRERRRSAARSLIGSWAESGAMPPSTTRRRFPSR